MPVPLLLIVIPIVIVMRMLVMALVLAELSGWQPLCCRHVFVTLGEGDNLMNFVIFDTDGQGGYAW